MRRRQANSTWRRIEQARNIMSDKQTKPENKLTQLTENKLMAASSLRHLIRRLNRRGSSGILHRRHIIRQAGIGCICGRASVVTRAENKAPIGRRVIEIGIKRIRRLASSLRRGGAAARGISKARRLSRHQINIRRHRIFLRRRHQ